MEIQLTWTDMIAVLLVMIVAAINYAIGYKLGLDKGFNMGVEHQKRLQEIKEGKRWRA